MNKQFFSSLPYIILNFQKLRYIGHNEDPQHIFMDQDQEKIPMIRPDSTTLTLMTQTNILLFKSRVLMTHYCQIPTLGNYLVSIAHEVMRRDESFEDDHPVGVLCSLCANQLSLQSFLFDL